MEYKHDVFISYNHEPGGAEWTRDLLYPNLTKVLHSLMPRKPDVFLDRRGLKPGGPWPKDLRDALLHSRCLLAVWSAPYRYSKWCQIEWQSMMSRQDLLTKRGHTELIVLPIRLADGNYYDDVRKQVEFEDLQGFYHIANCWKTSRLFPKFKQRVMKLAEQLLARIEAAPAWEDGWPIIEEPHIPPFPNVPRKGI